MTHEKVIKENKNKKTATKSLKEKRADKKIKQEKKRN